MWQKPVEMNEITIDKYWTIQFEWKIEFKIINEKCNKNNNEFSKSNNNN